MIGTFEVFLLEEDMYIRKIMITMNVCAQFSSSLGGVLFPNLENLT